MCNMNGNILIPIEYYYCMFTEYLSSNKKITPHLKIMFYFFRCTFHISTLLPARIYHTRIKKGKGETSLIKKMIEVAVSEIHKEGGSMRAQHRFIDFR